MRFSIYITDNYRIFVFESAWVEAAFGIKREDGKRVPNDAHRIPGHPFNDHIGHARSLPREDWQTVVRRILQRPLEFGGPQSPEGIVSIEEGPSASNPQGNCSHPASTVMLTTPGAIRRQ